MLILGRLHAALYDAALRQPEEAGLRTRRRALLAEASGRVLELGAGTGLNLAHYGPGVAELVLTEPDPHMARRLRERVAERDPTVAGSRSVRVEEAAAEDLPLASASFDCVVATLVLCSVRDQRAVLSEVARVLAPGGCFLFLEHVRAEEGALGRWQDLAAPLWALLGSGCHVNRRTEAALTGSPLRVERAEHGELREMPRLVRPMVTGVARA